MILTSDRESFYNREKRIHPPIGKDSPWAMLRLSHYPMFAQANNETLLVNSATLGTAALRTMFEAQQDQGYASGET